MENIQGTRDRYEVSVLATEDSLLQQIFYRKLRRCGKKMPRYCDVNNDKKITLSEWLNCLQTQRVQNEQTRPPHMEPKPPTQTKLKGVNPLEFILKAD